MKAVVFTKYGSPDVLELNEVPKPTPKDDEVLIRVHAASLNDWDVGALQGDSFVNRLIFGLLSPKKQILGSDIAGRIEAVGKDVRGLQPGAEVFGDLSGEWGGFAEYVCARENALALKPPGMTFEEAAAIPQAAMLAVQGLLDTGRIQPGQRLLVNGAGGGVGTFAIQIAKLYDVEITGVDSAEKLDMLRSMGADHVIDYTREDFTRNGQRYDLILDVKTNRSVFDYVRALTPNGIYVTVGGSMARLFQALLLWPWISITTNKRIGIVKLKPNKDLAYMNELFEAGKVMPVIDGPYKLSEVPKAFRRFGEGRHKGKIVITCLRLILAVALSVACAKETSVSPNPEWLTALIQTLESQPVANPPAFIARYNYRGETVYYLPPRCCDIPSILYSATGTIICNPDGGLSGSGDGRCSDFSAARTNEKVIWRDLRGGA